jgi:glycosyltransferase involved in cell wall biosynthesis
MNLLYNIADVTCLPSSNEGWGLSLTESLMAGTMIIGNVTGGIADQMRFEDKEGNWINFSPEVPSNHFGTYKTHGTWAIPVFPNNLSLVGSVQTPYIWDDHLDFRDLAKAIEECYNMGPERRKICGSNGRFWVTSDESMMSARNMCKNMVEGINETLEKFIPKKSFEIVKITEPVEKKIKHPLVY